MAEWRRLAALACDAPDVGRTVATRPGGDIDHAQWVAAVRRWRATLAQAAGTEVALYFADAADFAAALYGAWHAGKAVLLPGDAQAATLAQVRAVVDACAGNLPGALEAAAAPSPEPLQALDPSRCRLTVFTSGSGGEPVAIVKCLGQLDAEVHALQAAFGARIDADGPATVHATVSHQHIYGLLFLVLWPLAAGRPLASRRIDYPEQMAERLGPEPTVLVSSPAHLGRLPATLDWRVARQGLRAVFSSGGPLPFDAATETLKLLGHSPIEVFGSSETGGIAWRQRAVHGEHWQALPGVQWRIDDDRLAVRSAHLADDAWFLTSDRVAALPGGGFTLQGRADRIAKVGEKRISLSAIERELQASGDIREARALVLCDGATARLAVVAVPTGAGAALLAREGKRALDERLRSRLLGLLERVALPRRWRYVDALPVNLQGKSTEALLAGLFRPYLPVPRWLPGQAPEAQEASLEVDLHADLIVFDGHFPRRPILPGVTQVDWAIEFARQRFALPAPFMRLEALKFQRIAEPGMTLTLRLEWHPERGSLNFTWDSPAGRHCSGRALFDAGHAV